MNSKDIAKLVVGSLDKHKAEDIQIIGIRDLTVIADYFVIATGTSSTQVKALADYVEDELKEKEIMPQRVEGYPSASWILIDYGSVIVHVFFAETRAFYNLERLWKDGQQLDLADFLDENSGE
ncbi:MAG: ribosome silencing factor [Oscillospiraceae bacterium]|nr:ribosome silencing factor [Oscillospiraceae bacterium]MDD3833372.1 ribosome silencing factor [Oscillospiraceae bacterium]MDD4546715.1 ribosome silencing factor [Oscillospiraceae bacterium]